VHYKADYASTYTWSDIVYGVHYLYGTGSTWKDKIDQMNIEIVNHNNFWLLGTFFREKYDYKMERINDNTINIQLKDISLDYYEAFSIALVNLYEFDFGFWIDSKEETRWELRRRILTNNELVLLNKEQLRILRNSIYATNGYSFRSTDLQVYFSKKNWYKVNPNFSERSFFENEKINLDNISKEENRRN